MELLPEAAGPQDAVTTTSPRRTGSVRRTTSIDTLRPDGLRAEAIVDARARDLRTNADGTTAVVAEARLWARLSPSRELLELETTPAVPALDQLIGGSVGPGFRTRMGALVTEGCEEGSLLYLLLDDLTGATLVSGYALHRGGSLGPDPASNPDPASDSVANAEVVGAGDAPNSHPQPKDNPQVEDETRAISPGPAGPAPGPAPAPAAVPDPTPAQVPAQDPQSTPVQITIPAAPQFSFQEDICAGWAHDATMMLHLRDTGLLPVPIGPTAPVLEQDDDPLSWHAMAPLPAHAVRRRRRLDLMQPPHPGADHEVDMHFRDSHVDEGGHETIMHEYTLTGTVDPARGRVVTVSARVQVLPWMECPAALASAQRIDGMELAQLRPRVRREFVGRSTCTHLNDSLRSLADATALYRELEPNAVA